MVEFTVTIKFENPSAETMQFDFSYRPVRYTVLASDSTSACDKAWAMASEDGFIGSGRVNFEVD